jgi:ribosomal protein L4
MKLKVANGGAALDVSETTFGRDYNPALVFQVVQAYQAAGRAGTKARAHRGPVPSAAPSGSVAAAPLPPCRATSVRK